MEKIVITGANGFVGSSLAQKLLSSGNEITCLVRTGSNIDLIENKKDIVFVDYKNANEIKKIISNKDVLIHTAAIVRAPKWKSFQKVNIDLTQQLVQICNGSSLKQFIFLSSQAAAGPTSSENSLKKETNSAEPVTMYGQSKLLAEELIRKNLKTPWTIVRPVSVYGEGDKDFLELFKMVRNHIVVINSFRKKFYNLIYINELTELIEKTINNGVAFNETFFAANPSVIKNNELHKLIGKAIDSKTITLRIPEFLLFPIAFILEFISKTFRSKFPVLNIDKVKEFKQDYWIVDTNKVKKKLNIEFKDDYLLNFKKTYKWYKDKGWI